MRLADTGGSEPAGVTSLKPLKGRPDFAPRRSPQASRDHEIIWRPAGAALGRGTRETLKSCTMIITEPNTLVAEVHDRMPVVLEPDQFSPWLENEAGLEILVPAAECVLQRWPVQRT